MAEKITPEYIRKRFEYLMEAWRENRQQGDIDMRYVAGHVWDAKEKDARGGRPCMTFDLFSSYTNKVINNLRMNPRGVEVFPRGFGANDKTANNTADKIRQIQYDSMATGARITALENAVQRGMGFYRISIEYRKGTFDREIKVRRIPNPNQVLIDPDFREVNATDMRDFFIFEEWTKERFKREFPKAQVRDFSMDRAVQNATYFAKPDSVLIAEYWVKERVPDRLYLVQMNGAEEPETLYASDIKKAGMVVKDGMLWGESIDGMLVERGSVMAERPEERERVCQYWTNGFEILSEMEWEGSYLPLVAVLGRELWVQEGSGDKRQILSLVRLARDAAKLHAYASSSKAEIISMVPKNPWLIAKGQIDGNREDWDQAHIRPVAYLEYDPAPDAYPPGTQLPPPMRQPYEPPIQAFAQVADESRRSVMDAMGIDTLPTAAQRASQKSGVALKKIEEQQNLGAYHYTDSYEAAIGQEGRILADLIPKVYGAGQRTTVLRRDEKHEVIDVQAEVFAGEHDVTVKAGPNQESERQEAAEFAAQLATPELIGLALQDNPKASKLVALAIQLRAGGPIMEAIADLFDPAEEGQDDPKKALAQAQMQMQQMQQALQSLNALAQNLEQELMAERAKNDTVLTKTAMDNATKLEIERMKLGIEQQRLDIQRLTEVLKAQMQEFGANMDKVRFAASQQQSEQTVAE